MEGKFKFSGIVHHLLVNFYWLFGRLYCPWNIIVSQPVQSHTPRYFNLHQYCCENLRSSSYRIHRQVSYVKKTV